MLKPRKSLTIEPRNLRNYKMQIYWQPQRRWKVIMTKNSNIRNKSSRIKEKKNFKIKWPNWRRKKIRKLIKCNRNLKKRTEIFLLRKRKYLNNKAKQL